MSNRSATDRNYFTWFFVPSALGVNALLGAIVCLGQGSPLGPPPPFKPVITVRGGGVERNAPYRVPQRVVQGVVKDKDEKGIPRAEVFLLDEKTKQVRQMLADEAGTYLFGGLPLTNDYQVWVRLGSVTSPEKAGKFLHRDARCDGELSPEYGSRYSRGLEKDLSRSTVSVPAVRKRSSRM